MVKRSKLSDLTSKKTAPVDDQTQQPAKADEAAPVTPSYKGVLFKADRPTWVQLKMLAIELDTTQAELFCEAVNLLFEKHDKPQIAKHVSPPR